MPTDEQQADQAPGREAQTDDPSTDDPRGDVKSERDETLARLSSERKEARDRARKAEQRLAELENAGKSELDKLTGERDALRERVQTQQQRLGRASVIEAATKANAVVPRAIYGLMRDDIEFDDDGEPTNIDALIAALRQDDASLFKASAGSADGGKRGESATDTDLNSLLRNLRTAAR